MSEHRTLVNTPQERYFTGPAQVLLLIHPLLPGPQNPQPSEIVATRVADARAIQAERFRDAPGARVNADATGALLDKVARPDDAGRELLAKAAEKIGLTARGYHRVLRVSRTIADLGGADGVTHTHVAEALSFRLVSASGA